MAKMRDRWVRMVFIVTPSFVAASAGVEPSAIISAIRDSLDVSPERAERISWEGGKFVPAALMNTAAWPGPSDLLWSDLPKGSM